MTKLNRKVEYSLIALKHMSAKPKGELTTAKEIADLYNSPFEMMARVLQKMAQKGLLKSEQGATGGYRLKTDLTDLSFLDLIQLIEGPTSVAKCIHKKSACEIHKTCNIISPMHQLNKKMNEFYGQMKLSEILQVPS